MTETPATPHFPEQRKLDPVVVAVTVLLGLLLGAVAWLIVTPDTSHNAAPSAPLAVLSLPPSTAMVTTQPPVAPEPPQAAPQPPDTAPSPPPAAVAETPAPPATPPAPPAADTVIAAQPPVAMPQPPAPEPPPAAVPPPPPAPAPLAAAPPGPAGRDAISPIPDLPAPSQTTAIPQPPAFEPPQRGQPAPAPDGLGPAPDQNLVEPSRDGPLPVVGKDGRKPWQVYARPFDQADKRPRVALIFSGLGQSTAATEAAIQRLPGGVTLAFAPYAKNLDQWIGLARAAGHEVLLTVPMEPIGYPENDPGPHTLLTNLSERENRDRLLFLLSRFTGYVGVLNTMGARLTTAPQSLKPILEEIKDRGLIFVDARSSLRSVAAAQATEIGLPRAINNRFIDIKAARSDIDQRLDELERIARGSGYALGIGSPYPVTIERVALWVRELESKGIALAPVSALVDKQPD